MYPSAHGCSSIATQNTVIGQFDMAGVPPAPKDVPHLLVGVDDDTQWLEVF